MSTEQRKEDTETKNRINESQTRNRRQKKKVQIAFTLKGVNKEPIWADR